MFMAIWAVNPDTPMSEVVQFLSRMAQEKEEGAELREKFESIEAEKKAAPEAADAKIRALLTEEGLSKEAQDILVQNDKSEIIRRIFDKGACIW